VKYIIGPFGEAEGAIAMNPLCEEEGVLHITASGREGVCDPKWHMAFNSMYDAHNYIQAGYAWLKESHPEVKRVAIVSQDEEGGRGSTVWALKACKDNGFEVVYQNLFPMDTVDLYPIMTAIVESKPDIVDMGSTFAPFAVALIEAGNTLGFEGTYMSTVYDKPMLFSKVSPEYVEGYVTNYPYMNWNTDMLPSECKWFYDIWEENYPDTWGSTSPIFYCPARILLEGIKAADSVDPIKIADAFETMGTLHHPMGDCRWTGEEIWGTNHTVEIPNPINELRDGETETVKVYTAIPRPWNYDLTGIPGAEEWLKYRPK
jgi:branched-chain amino acid transport system substrate-binding protein